jgi:hypothetical protein
LIAHPVIHKKLVQPASVETHPDQPEATTLFLDQGEESPPGYQHQAGLTGHLSDPQGGLGHHGYAYSFILSHEITETERISLTVCSQRITA